MSECPSIRRQARLLLAEALFSVSAVMLISHYAGPYSPYSNPTAQALGVNVFDADTVLSMVGMIASVLMVLQKVSLGFAGLVSFLASFKLATKFFTALTPFSMVYPAYSSPLLPPGIICVNVADILWCALIIICAVFALWDGGLLKIRSEKHEKIHQN